MTRTPVINLFIVFGLLLGPFGGSFFAEPNDQMAPTSPVLYVKSGASGDCSSWGEACDLQTALRVAVSGDEIWVQQGLYKPTSFGYANCQEIEDAFPGSPDGEYSLQMKPSSARAW